MGEEGGELDGEAGGYLGVGEGEEVLGEDEGPEVGAAPVGLG